MKRCETARCPASYPHSAAVYNPQRHKTSDNRGGYTTGPRVKIADIKCSIKTKDADEVFENTQISGVMIYEIRTRYSTALAAADLVKAQVDFDSRTFEVVSVANVDEMNVEYKLKCVEVPYAG